jgi:hypothetical protein
MATGTVAGSSRGRLSPRQRIEAECARRGRDAVTAGCLALLREEPVERGLVRALGGPGAEKFFDGDEHEDTYWLRVWALRGLLWSWDPAALEAVRGALGDPAWRVREMAAKVVARHLLGEALPMVADLRADPVPRVRAAADRALVRISEADA